MTKDGAQSFTGKGSQAMLSYYSGKIQEAAQAWHELPEERKAEYAKVAQEELAKWKEEESKYWKTVDPNVIKEINRRRKIKGLKALRPPKALRDPRAVSAYMLHIKKSIEGSEGQAPHKLVEAARVWRGMTDEEKQPMRDLAAKENQARGIETPKKD